MILLFFTVYLVCSWVIWTSSVFQMRRMHVVLSLVMEMQLVGGDLPVFCFCFFFLFCSGLHQWCFVNRRAEETFDWNPAANDRLPPRETQAGHGGHGETVHDATQIRLQLLVMEGSTEGCGVGNLNTVLYWNSVSWCLEAPPHQELFTFAYKNNNNKLKI